MFNVKLIFWLCAAYFLPSLYWLHCAATDGRLMRLLIVGRQHGLHF